MSAGHDSQTDQLIALGLTRYEALVYLALLGRQGFTPAQAAARAGVPRQRIYDVLAALSGRGLCLERHIDGQRLYFASDPAAALPALMEQRRRQAEAEQARLESQAGELAAALAPAFLAGAGVGDPLDYVDVLLDRRLVAERAVALSEAAEREICVCFRLPLVGDAAANLAEVELPRRRGVRYRSLYEHAALADPAVRSWLARFLELGQEARAIGRLPIKLNLYDSRVALMALQDPVTGTTSLTALCVTHPGLAQTLQLAFEGMWGAAEPIRPEDL